MDSTKTQARVKTRFFSLKWKIILIVSLILVLISSSIILINHLRLNKLFENQLATTIENNSIATLEQTKKHLIDLTSTIRPSNQAANIQSKDITRLEGYINQNFYLMEIDWGIESLSLYNSDTEQVLHWGANIASTKLKELITTTGKTFSPNTDIFCEEQCWLSAALPIYLDHKPYILITSTTLVDFIMNFSENNQFYTALLRKNTPRKSLSDFTVWGLKIVGMTGKSEYLNIFRELDQNISLSDFIDNSITINSNSNQYHYLHAIKIEKNDEDNIIVLISDTTRENTEIYENLVLVGKITAIGLILSLSSIFLVLITPLNRIKKQARLLPLLAEGKFKDVRSALKNRQPYSIGKDELDVLDETAISLSKQLELMGNEIRSRTDELEKLALYDVLTGLANRRLFTEQLKTMIEEFHKHKEAFAVIFIDLDNFKGINDTLGHKAGDDLLIEVGKRLTDSVRSSDVVSRLGGDEFTVLLPQSLNIKNISKTADKILNSFQTPFLLEGQDVIVTPSIGISIGPDDGISVKELMRCADIAMYEAKENGKNCYAFFKADMEEHVKPPKSME